MDELPSTLDLAFAKIRLQLNSTVQAVRRPASLLLAVEGKFNNLRRLLTICSADWLGMHRNTQKVDG